MEINVATAVFQGTIFSKCSLTDRVKPGQSNFQSFKLDPKLVPERAQHNGGKM